MFKNSDSELFFGSVMIYIPTPLYRYRLRVIGFPLNLWVGSQVGTENRDSVTLPFTSKLILRITYSFS
jgi:hypothetical protein